MARITMAQAVQTVRAEVERVETAMFYGRCTSEMMSDAHRQIVYACEDVCADWGSDEEFVLVMLKRAFNAMQYSFEKNNTK